MRYTRVLPPEDDSTSPIGRSWKNTYNVATKAELESKLAEKKGVEFVWKENDCIQITSEVLPAIRFITEQHGDYLYQYTFYNSVIAAFLGWEDSRNDRLKAVRFGDDSAMPFDILDKVATFMEQSKVSHVWRQGDVLAIHNGNSLNFKK